jgi:hypothetical protein
MLCTGAIQQQKTARLEYKETSEEVMKKSQMLSALNATFFATFSIIAEASIVWDYSPATTGGDGVTNWGNFSTDQNFAETIIFSQPIRITGMDIYSATGQGVVGDSATIRLWTDDQGVPDQLIQNFAETITVVDSDGIGSVFDITRKHVNFSAPVFCLQVQPTGLA